MPSTPSIAPSKQASFSAALPVRAQLVLGSIVVLLLLLCVFGVAVRYIASTTLMIGVDNDLSHQLEGFVAHHGPHGGPEPGGGPPPGQTALGMLLDGGSIHGPDGNGPGGGPPPGDFRGGGDGGPPGLPPLGGFDSGGGGASGARGFQKDRFDQRRLGGGPPDDASAAGNPYGPRLFASVNRAAEPGRHYLASLDPDSLRQALDTGKPVYSTIIDGGQRVRVFSEPAKIGFGPDETRGAAQAGYPLGGVDRALRSVDRALLMLIPLALVCAGAGGWWITGRALRRVGQITRAAAAIGARNLSQRLPAAGSDEFSALARTFNGLLDRVDAAFQEQRRFTADASHELKTPLTVIQGTTSLALSLGEQATLDHGAVQEIDRAAASMAHLVQDLLYLARADADAGASAGTGATASENGVGVGSGHGSSRRVELLLADPIERAVGIVAPRSQAHVTLQKPQEPVCVRASESELTRLFLNLLENAARYTPEGGSITVTIHLEDGGRTAVARVADTGIGIAPEHLPRLTDRFYRVDDSRTRAAESSEAGGSGLGLAICKSIAEAHGGSLEIDSEVGAGTRVTVRLLACTDPIRAPAHLP